MEDYPKFAFGKSRFDLSTFIGRFYQNVEIIDPRTLFVTDSKLQESIKLLDDFQKGRPLPPNVSDKDLWEANKIKSAIIHPDTGEKIFMPFRMSGYVPFNAPVLAGLLLPGPTIAQTIFWQWLNQSHNACVNYANRNATKPTNMKTFIQGYVGAVGAAISLAVGLNVMIRRANNVKPAVKLLIQRFIPFPAVATASTLNVVLMRRHELDEGINVTDKDGNVVGSSKLAAKKALKEMAITRALLPAPLLTIPPIIMSFFEKTKTLRKNPRLAIPLNILVCSVCFIIALPATIAVFPTMSEVKVSDLEEDIQKASSEPVVYFNKGL